MIVHHSIHHWTIDNMISPTLPEHNPLLMNDGPVMINPPMQVNMMQSRRCIMSIRYILPQPKLLHHPIGVVPLYDMKKNK